MKTIDLTQGKIAIVDDEDYERLVKYNWQFDCYNYAQRCIPTESGWRIMRMHREILDALPDEEIDHIDGDGLNNQRSNLRKCTRSQNNANRLPRRDNRTGIKGVTKVGNKWRARIVVDYKTVHLGVYNNPEAAGKAYDAAARRYFGEFARINFP